MTLDSMLADPLAGRRIHARLGAGLAHLCDTCADIPRPAAADIARLADEIAAGAVLPPARFDDYFALVRAVMGGDAGATARSARRLAQGAQDPAPRGIAIRPLSDRCFSRAGQAALRAHFASDSLHSRQIMRVPEAQVDTVIARIEAALELIRAHAPVSHGVLAAITREIVPVMGRARDGMTFDGCSSIERWGAILINMKIKRTPLVLAETLIHESSHSHLFDLGHDSALTLNPMDERYRSPLRIDPRPIDGIFHAVFVLSRMYGFLSEVASSGTAPAALRDEARALADKRAGAFNDGYGVIEAHGRLTERGQQILASARAIVPR